MQVWRDGQTLALKVKPGRLGIGMAKGAAAEALASARATDTLLAQVTRGPALTPLPGTRREVEAIASLFPQSEKLLGAAANRAALLRALTPPGSPALTQPGSPQTLSPPGGEGRVRGFDVIHLATHGLTDPYTASQSAIFLSQSPEDNGKVTALEMKDWQLNADLVVLSACESGLGLYSGGDGYLGFTQALFLANTRSVVLSLWKVDDAATALLMVRFYENWLGNRAGALGALTQPRSPMSKAEALREAKHWLRTLSRQEAEKKIAGLPEAARGLKIVPAAGINPAAREPGAREPGAREDKPFAHPFYWSAFILIGDPE